MNQTQLIKLDDTIEVAPGVKTSIAQLLNTAPEEINGRGIVLQNVKRTFRVTDAYDVDGRPVELVFNLYAHRAPVNADEADKLSATAEDKKAKQLAKKIAEAETRQREIEEARRRQEHDLLKGMSFSKQSAEPVAAKVKEALDLAAVLASAMPKSLPEAK